MKNNEQEEIKLDLCDRKILSELDKNCRIPSTKIAKIVRKSRQTIEYRITNLIKNGVILGFQTSINPHKMGYKIYKVYLKLKNVPYEKEIMLKYLRQASIVYWMGECSGSWDLIFGVFCKTDYEFFDFKNNFISKFRDIIIDSFGEPLIDVTQYPKMYFTNTLSEPTMFAGEVVNNELDKIDYAILGEVVNNGRRSLVDIASNIHSTVIVVMNRLKKLERLGIIIQYRIGIDIGKIGLGLYKTVIKLERYTKDDEHKLLDYLSDIPNIQYFIRNVWQLEVELVARNYQEYYNIIENLKETFPEMIRSIDSVLMITDEWTPGFRNLLKNS